MLRDSNPGCVLCDGLLFCTYVNLFVLEVNKGNCILQYSHMDRNESKLYSAALCGHIYH